MKKNSISGPEKGAPGKKTLKCSKDSLAIAREAIRKHRKALDLLKAYDKSRPPKGSSEKSGKACQMNKAGGRASVSDDTSND